MGPIQYAPFSSSRETEQQAVKTAATLDSDFLRKIPPARARAKPRQKSHTSNCGKARAR